MSSLMAKGGVFASLRISRVVACTSTSPVARLGFFASSERSTTLPVMRRTYSLRTPATASSEASAARVGPEHDLDEAGAIAQVDEGDAAVIAPSMHPPGQRDLLASVLRTQVSTVVRLEHAVPHSPGR